MVFPTPGGPNNTMFSVRSRKLRSVSSRMTFRSIEGWKGKSNWSTVLTQGKRACARNAL